MKRSVIIYVEMESDSDMDEFSGKVVQALHSHIELIDQSKKVDKKSPKILGKTGEQIISEELTLKWQAFNSFYLADKVLLDEFEHFLKKAKERTVATP